MSPMRSRTCRCGQEFYLHTRCDRGDRYCSRACAQKRRKELAVQYQLKYQREKRRLEREQAKRERVQAHGVKSTSDPTEVEPSVATAVVAGNSTEPMGQAVDSIDQQGRVPTGTSIAGPDTTTGSDCSTSIARLGGAGDPVGQEGARMSTAVTVFSGMIEHSHNCTARSGVIVAQGPEGLTASNESPDETVVAGDYAGLATNAGLVDTRSGQERAWSAPAAGSAAPTGGSKPHRDAITVAQEVAPCCARCGQPGFLMRRAQRAPVACGP